jgi:hypothetical protein
LGGLNYRLLPFWVLSIDNFAPPPPQKRLPAREVECRSSLGGSITKKCFLERDRKLPATGQTTNVVEDHDDAPHWHAADLPLAGLP